MDERIGNYIRPVKLRIFGNLNTPYTSGPTGPIAFSARCMVVQLKSLAFGDGLVVGPREAYSAHFNGWNPVFDPGVGDLSFETHKRWFYQQFFSNYQDGDRISPGVAAVNFGRSQILSKMPFRPGFGRAVRVLYDHTYQVGTRQGLKQNVSFRIKTKVPRVMAWVPNKTANPGDFSVVTEHTCNNPVYIVWFFIPHQMEDVNGQYDRQRYDVELSYTVQLYYVDP